VGPRVGLGGLEKRKSLCAPEFELRNFQAVWYRYTDYNKPACHYVTKLNAYIFSLTNFDSTSFSKELEAS